MQRGDNAGKEVMKVLVVGASGATGQLLVAELLNRGLTVRIIVRSTDALPEFIKNHPQCSIVQASLLELNDIELAEHSDGCSAIASCLGHNLSLKGIFGKPRKLVTEATMRLCKSILDHKRELSVKFVLMNTAGHRNRDLQEPISAAQRFTITLIRLLLPPQVDNEEAADYLRTEIGQNNNKIRWAAVRPDSLIDRSSVSDYKVFPSPIRSAIFNAGKTSRINVAHFMADLITEEDTWSQWQGKMPVIYNAESAG